MSKTTTEAAPAAAATQDAQALEVRDARTGKSYRMPILTEGVEGDQAIRGMDLRQVKANAGEFGLMSYDPAFMNTASCKSAITFTWRRSMPRIAWSPSTPSARMGMR